MLLKNIPIFSALTRQMDWLASRQKVLSHNIANADTPGFRGRDLERLSFRELLTRPDDSMRVAKTNAGHIAPSGEASDDYRRSRETGYDTNPADNSVSLEDEIIKVNDTRMAYDLASSLYRKHVQMVKMAIGGRGG
ncbi:flagellar basal body rod protein FlgB [Minwuia thermotolerans]|jgi:flagellar basal-body rod protein FlgB|uniref:Flagellar basal body rod protein FlgB n=1 Tax=Minwuia thermotolerans TaxID=2056226 RepID=A0A2M9G6S6_9PROT|nr:flagellar basal body rod protein FlgB [Minwuia thermotolerans]ANK81046.1 MAG: flagellar basal-body rod protein FlgB [Rhizobiales bacterium NRL2]PJK31410.1 flagellar basal body rod protein FlgB [Minwuia thermotolerans]